MREKTEQATTTSLYIEWDESPPTTCDGVTWYEFSYTMDKTYTSNVTNITTNNTHYKLTELVEDATYYITLVAVNAVGQSQSVHVEVFNKHQKGNKRSIYYLEQTNILLLNSYYISVSSV